MSSAKRWPFCFSLKVLTRRRNTEHVFMGELYHRWLRPRTWWRHQIETFSALLALCAGYSPVPLNSPPKDQWRGALMFSLICAWINDWVNKRKAGDLRRHYDVNVMRRQFITWINANVLPIGQIVTEIRTKTSMRWRPFHSGFNVLIEFYLAR